VPVVGDPLGLGREGPASRAQGDSDPLRLSRPTQKLRLLHCLCQWRGSEEERLVGGRPGGLPEGHRHAGGGSRRATDMREVALAVLRAMWALNLKQPPKIIQ
jgi:hypothetical protein